MSNKRRKSIGQRKLRRNWLIRQARGSGGDDWQGDGRQYRADKGWVLAPDVKRRKDEPDRGDAGPRGAVLGWVQSLQGW